MEITIHRLGREELLKTFTASEAKRRPQEWILDTETDGLEVLGPESKHSAWYIGLMPFGTPHVFIISIEEYREWGLAEWFKDMRFIGHNLRFDFHALDLQPKQLWKDTMVAAYFNHTSGRRSMDHIARVNGWENIPTPDLLKQGRIGEIPKEELFEYLANDCLLTAKMAKRVSVIGANQLDRRVEQAVYNMECRGVRLLTEQFDLVQHELEEILEERTLALRSEGMHDNLNSPIHMSAWLLSKGCRLPYTPSGQPSTAKIVLQQLADGGNRYAQLILDYRKAVKLKTSFIEPLPKLTQDGILYPKTNTTRTKTGRFSCDTPNLQQIPKRGPLGKAIRGCLTSADNTGVIACDFSQIELRVAAAFAEEAVLLEAFEQGNCPHTQVAAKMVGKTTDQVTPDERFKAKAVNFGILNGMGASRLAVELKTDRSVATKFLNDYRRNLPQLYSWMESVWREAEAYQLARTVEGRTRIFSVREETRPAVSVIVQGSAAELMRHALVAVEQAGLNPFLSIHDEILIPGTEKYDSLERLENLQEVMETAANAAYPEVFSSVQFSASANFGSTWGDV